MFFYINPRPRLADVKELLRDPKGLAHLAVFLWLLIAYTQQAVGLKANVSLIDYLYLFVFQGVLLGFLGMLAFNELGLAYVRQSAIERGFKRPLPPRYGVVLNRILGGKIFYLALLWLISLAWLFSPAGPGISVAFQTTPTMILFALVVYGISYSNERYQAWYAEIWPDEGDGGWDGDFVPDPTPQDQLAI